MPPPEQEQQLQPSVSSALWKNLLHPPCVLSRVKNGFAQMGAICCLKKKKKLLAALLLCYVFIDLV